ncbi:DUF4292 domain-containing protein [Flavobacterium sp.]|uniref:DUF4292 domain-containing protein n=1 Tax=Flavobacterium sp. TaxID=239 RepID=UPI00286B711E|nr:DUF4292 domain-containing protein [Flavobacterium sp.]
MRQYRFAFFIFFISPLTIVSCKSKAVLLSEGKAKDLITADTIIKKHYQNKKDFTTLYIKSSAHYEDPNQSQNVTAEIKIKKDEIILISIRFLGITMAKALITPNEVKYYEKINGNYFEGDYSLLSRWLGTDLDFNKVQNLLIGQALDDLHKGSFTTSIEDTLYKLEDNSDASTSKSYYFESGKFLIKKQQVTQSEKERTVQIVYPNFGNYNQMALPTKIVIDAMQKKGKVNIEIDYNSVTFDEELSFPYSVPEGYERIFIN